MANLKKLILIFVFVAYSYYTANAAVVPTPPPGTATILSAPVPNPNNFNYSSGTSVSSSQVNSTNFKIYNDINAAINALNGCTVYTGTQITSLSSANGIVGVLGSCIVNAGTGISLALSLPSITTGTISASTVTASGIYSSAGLGLSVPGPFYPYVISSSGSAYGNGVTYHIVDTGDYISTYAGASHTYVLSVQSAYTGRATYGCTLVNIRNATGHFQEIVTLSGTQFQIQTTDGFSGISGGAICYGQ